MARRKAKKPQPDDTSILLEPPVPQTRRRLNSYTSSALLIIVVFVVGASIMGWFCAQQQGSIDQLSDSFTTMQRRIANFQQVMSTTDEQVGYDVEDRIFALEEAHKQAQEKAEVAQAASEKLKNSDLFSQMLDLHDEMDTRVAELNQVSLSVTTLHALFKNQSEEFDAVKESVVAGLSSTSELHENVAELTDAVATACSRVDQQVASVEALNAKMKGQAAVLDELIESVDLHKEALHTNNQEMAAIKEIIKAEQAMRAQALKEMVKAVQMTLDEQFFTSQTLHSSVMAQLQTFHNQLAHTPSWSVKPQSDEESSAAEELISTTAQNTTEAQETPEEDEGKDKQQDAAEDETEDAAEEEEEIQEEEPVEQEMVTDAAEEEEVTEEGEEEEEEEMTPEELEEEEDELAPEEEEEEFPEEEITLEELEEEEVTEEEEEATAEEQEEEEVTRQSGQLGAIQETAEKEIMEETVDRHLFEESLEDEEEEEEEEEEDSEDVYARWETLSEQSVE